MRGASVFAATLGAVLGAIVLFVVGAFIGGNFTPSFELGGLRGYEATGVVGLVVGMLGGGALGLRIANQRT